MASGFSIRVKAQSSWPDKTKTIKVIVPWPPGAVNDALRRFVPQRLQETMGATSIAESASETRLHRERSEVLGQLLNLIKYEPT